MTVKIEKGLYQAARKHLPQKFQKFLRRRLPITTWLPKYSSRDFVGDLIAGVTVGLTMVPQSIAYAAVAGLTPEYGLYSSYLGTFIYIFLGTCRESSVGPTSTPSLAVFQICGSANPQCAILTSFYAGIIIFILALFQLGWIVSLISEPVSIGFAAGSAFTILGSQVKPLLGLPSGHDKGFSVYWGNLAKNTHLLCNYDALVGTGSVVTLLLLQNLPLFNPDNNVLKRVLRMLSVCRNAIVIMTSSLIAYTLQTPPFKLTGDVKSGLPRLGLPHFQLEHPPYMLNATLRESTETLGFLETINFLGFGPLVLAVLLLLQNVTVMKVFGTGQAVDASQEMYFLGISNIIGGFFTSFSTSSSFSRSAVNHSSGVRTPMHGLFTGMLVIVAISFLTKSFYWIPKASLAAVIIVASFSIIDFKCLLPMWRISKSDAIACVSTLLISLALGMEYAIMAGVAISVMKLLRRHLFPKVFYAEMDEPSTKLKYVLIKPNAGLSFAGVNHVTTKVQKLVLKYKNINVFVIDFSNWKACDYSAAVTITSLYEGLEENGKSLLFSNCNEKWIQALENVGMRNISNVNCVEQEMSRILLEQQSIRKSITRMSSLSIDSCGSSVTTFSVVSIDNGLENVCVSSSKS